MKMEIAAREVEVAAANCLLFTCAVNVVMRVVLSAVAAQVQKKTLLHHNLNLKYHSTQMQPSLMEQLLSNQQPK